MLADYNPQAIEAKWQKRWEEARAFESEADSSKPKYYALEMLPYPSGTLHMGHMRNYTIGDVVARVKRMRGFNVLHPMGWDAFGLPAENAAIKNHTHPRTWTNQNITEFQRVLRRFGFSYDWRREISTCEPEYYRWNQWFFLRMLERGLAYRKKSRVNWCPKCCTVLANEQVINGYCWRHEDTLVEVREIEQWFLKTTAYAEQLLDDLKLLEGGWPERVITMQRNWIGKSVGARVKFALVDVGGIEPIEVFTTRIDTIYGATALILAPTHPLVARLLEGSPERAGAEGLLAQMRKASTKAEDLATAEKEGFFTGRQVTNPFSGERIPIWVGNFVLLEYGTGAVMCVPAHDERDFEFCRKYGLPVRVVVQPREGEPLVPENMTNAYGDDSNGKLVNSGPYDGLAPHVAIIKMAAFAQDQGFGRREMKMQPEELTDCIIYQVGALKGFLEREGMQLFHVKPHGSLYGMAAKSQEIAKAIADAVKVFKVPVMGMVGTVHERVYPSEGLEFISEYYADLDYADDGMVIITREHQAFDPQRAAERALRAVNEGVALSVNGKEVQVRADSICVHSDTPNATVLAQAVKTAVADYLS